MQITDSYDAEKKLYRLSVRQSCPSTPGQDRKDPFHIPMTLGLVGENGQDMRLIQETADGIVEKGTQATFEITETAQELVFQGVASKPVPSLFRHFSAPVKIDYAYSRDQLRFLMAHDSDGFNRWDAGQRLAIGVLNDLAGAAREGKPLEVDTAYLDAFAPVLESAEGDDYAMLAKMLAVPSLSFLAELSETIYVDALIAARETLLKAIVNRWEAEIVSRYQSLASHPDAQRLDSRAMGIRAFKNACLMLLALGESPRLSELAQTQFANADNMTDELAGLTALLTANDIHADKALEKFYERWHHDALVMESWFSVQAASDGFGSLDRVVELTRHPLFSEKNPNKVRSVIGVFGGQNWKQFHQSDGTGYQFLTDWILKMDKLNPQIASRLVTPLTRWRKYEAERASMMQAKLQDIAGQAGLSKDVYEVVSKSLK